MNKKAAYCKAAIFKNVILFDKIVIDFCKYVLYNIIILIVNLTIDYE